MMIKLNDKTYVLELMGSGDNACHPTLLMTDGGPALFDAGFDFTHDELVAQMESAGVTVAQLRALFITHHDMDHIGGAKALLQENDQIRVFAHIFEVPFIEGSLPPLKSGPGEPPDPATYAIKVNNTLVDEHVIDIIDCLVIQMLGHTYGHIAYYLRDSKTLICGDSLVAFGGVLQGPRPEFCYDLEVAHEQLSRFLDLNIKTCICYHGGVVQGDIHAELQRVIAAGPGAYPSPARDFA